MKPHNDAESAHPKKAYSSPYLIQYGTVRALTQAIGPNGMNDNMTGAKNSKTSL